MEKLFTSEKIYIAKSKISGSGRGVFARQNILKDEIIEICPTIMVSKYDTAKLSESLLNTYFFYLGKKRDQLAIVLGFGSIYNHSYKPNSKFKINQKSKTVEFISLSNIKKDAEITFNYRNSQEVDTPLWFEV